MPLTMFAVLALLLATTFHGQAEPTVADRLVRAAFFSDACRQEGEALAVARSSDANALVAAFAGLRRQRASASGADAVHEDCRVPAIVLINLLRLNGVEADLVFAKTVKGETRADQTERVLVYVPTLDRYVDPALPPEEQSLVDLLVRERAERTHLLGPSLGGNARDPCPDTCMHVYTAGNAMPPVRVKTEVIRGR
jgi:hypothetical protein